MSVIILNTTISRRIERFHRHGRNHVEARTGSPLFTRYSGNPILTQENWPYPINSVFNAAAVKLADGDTLLLCRVEDRSGLSHLCAARSANGVDGLAD